MRNLHSSLPRPSRRHRHANTQPSTELLKAFKAAALSVTQLYKTAAADEDGRSDNTHAAGYQDALDDLLDFLDQQNLGLGDGEGWAVRQWATQRLTASAGPASTSPPPNVSDEEDAGTVRSASPVAQQKNTSANTSSNATDATQNAHDRDESSPPESRPDVFHFRSNVSMPPSTDTEMVNAQPSQNHSARRSPSAVRLEVLPSSRQSRQHGSARQLGHGAGNKRKVALADFFDVAGLTGFGDKRDGGAGGGNAGAGGFGNGGATASKRTRFGQ